MINRYNWNKVKPLAPSWKATYFIFDVNVKGLEEGSVLIKNQEQKVSEMSRRHRDESRCGGHMKNWCERGKNLNGARAVMRECIRGKQKRREG